MSWAWFLDIDGTLLEIAPTPATVIVHHELPDMISRLQYLSRGALALISGRAIADIDRILRFSGLTIVGQHGLEIRMPDGTMMALPVADTGLEEVRAAVSAAAERHPGLLPEFKGKSIALHYRGAPQLAGYAHSLMRTLARRHAPGFEIQKGKRVVELRSSAADKGAAIRRLMTIEPFTGRTPVFLGDDVTDESGFAAVNEMSGHSIKIGRGRTAAKWRLVDVPAVREWLRRGMHDDQATGGSSRA